MCPLSYKRLMINKQKNLGLTLVELLITLTIVSIVVGLAVPSFSALTKSNALTSQSNYFTSAIQLARSEAIKRNTRVIVCTRSGTSCGTTSDWEDGWIVFADDDRDSLLDAGEEIRVFDELPAGYTLRPNDTRRRGVSFNSAGTIDGGLSRVSFALCDPSGDIDDARELVLNAAGRIRADEGVAVCR